MFLEWLLSMSARQDSIGQLARDLQQDGAISETMTPEDIMHYLISINASDETLNALEESAVEFQHTAISIRIPHGTNVTALVGYLREMADKLEQGEISYD